MSLTVDIDKRDDRGRTALHRAAERGNAAEVERLLASGADANAKNAPFHNTALHVAETFEVVRLLVDYGANIEALSDNVATALRYHCSRRRTSCVEFLCFKGANVNHKDDRGGTPIFVADVAAVEVLSAFDADINAANSTGFTPLMWAERYSSPHCVRLLLALNADTTKVDTHGWSVSHTKNEYNKQLLLEHSKKSEKERKELRTATLNRIRYQLAVRLMQYAQPEIIGICVALAPLELPPYVLLWIIDWLPNYDRLSPRHKIRLIESVCASISKIKEQRDEREQQQKRLKL